jgi:hypothetical protein
MTENGIEPKWMVIELSGNEFKNTIFKRMNFTEYVPESCEFVAYEFIKAKNKKRSRLFMCQFEGGCSKIIVSISKLFSHIMSHTQEKPYQCTYPGCLMTFGYKGNLQKHLKGTHEGIKRY